MKFEDYSIHPGVKDALARMGFKRPTDIQYKCIPPILRREDVLAIAQTGTGKTAAFAIPLVSMLSLRLTGSRADGIKALIMEPTHELAEQVAGVFNQIESETRVRTICIHGGVDQDPQIQALKDGADILVATPGRMFDLVSQGHLDLHRVETLVLDEADHMLDLGFRRDIDGLIMKLPRKRQSLFFSATINDGIKKMAAYLAGNAVRIQLSPKDPVSKNVVHSVAHIEMDEKRFFLERLINEHTENKFLVFVRTKVRAERVSAAMKRVGIETLTIHSGKEAGTRESTMKAYRSGEVRVLIATDVSARGIDLPDIDQVVNYDLPDKPENYVHRVGRTGRGKNRGVAVSFCSTEEQPMLDEIEKFLGKPVNILEVDAADRDITVQLSNEFDWKTLMKNDEKMSAQIPKKKGKKGKRK